MAFKIKDWKNRVSEYPNRRNLIKSDGSTEIVTVERSEGTVSVEGDAFSAENMNDLETRVSNEFKAVNTSLGGLTFAQDSEGNWGYKPSGADTVIPFKTGGDTALLYEALQYSGLVTADMTYEEMCAALAEYFPEGLTITNTWSGGVSASSAGEDGVDEQYNKSGAIDVSKYSKLIWAGDTGNQHNYGTNTLRIYGGSSEGASNYFSHDLTPGESFSYEIDISSISTIYLTAYAKAESYSYATEGCGIATTTLRAK